WLSRVFASNMAGIASWYAGRVTSPCSNAEASLRVPLSSYCPDNSGRNMPAVETGASWLALPEGQFERHAHFRQCLVRLRHHLTHGDEAVDLAFEFAQDNGNVGRLQSHGIGLAFVAQRVMAGDQHISRRQAGQAFRLERRGTPVVAVVGAVQILLLEPVHAAARQQMALAEPAVRLRIHM